MIQKDILWHSRDHKRRDIFFTSLKVCDRYRGEDTAEKSYLHHDMLKTFLGAFLDNATSTPKETTVSSILLVTTSLPSYLGEETTLSHCSP